MLLELDWSRAIPKKWCKCSVVFGPLKEELMIILVTTVQLDTNVSSGDGEFYTDDSDTDNTRKCCKKLKISQYRNDVKSWSYECDSNKIENEFRRYDCDLGLGPWIKRWLGKDANGGPHIMGWENSNPVNRISLKGSLKSGQTVSEDEQCWYDDYSEKFQFHSGVLVDLRFECLEYLDE